MTPRIIAERRAELGEHAVDDEYLLTGCGSDCRACGYCENVDFVKLDDDFLCADGCRQAKDDLDLVADAGREPPKRAAR